MREWFDATGAGMMGRMMYDSGEEFWGRQPALPDPGLRPHPPPPTGRRPPPATGNRNVDIAGGAHTVRQYLAEDLVDELQLHVVPALLGDGLRLFEGLGTGQRPRPVEPVRVVHTPLAVHLKYRLANVRETSAR